MESGWLLADGEAVASAQSVRTPAEWRRACTRGAPRVSWRPSLRTPAVLLGPLDVVRVRAGELATDVRAVGHRPVCLVRPGLVVVGRPGDAARCGLRRGATVELRWAS